MRATVAAEIGIVSFNDPKVFAVNDVFVPLFSGSMDAQFLLNSGGNKVGFLGKMMLPDELRGNQVYFYKNPKLSFFDRQVNATPNTSISQGANAMVGTSCYISFKEIAEYCVTWQSTIFQVIGNKNISLEIFRAFCAIADVKFEHSDRYSGTAESEYVRIYDKMNSRVGGDLYGIFPGAITVAISPTNFNLTIAHRSAPSR